MRPPWPSSSRKLSVGAGVGVGIVIGDWSFLGVCLYPGIEDSVVEYGVLSGNFLVERNVIYLVCYQPLSLPLGATCRNSNTT